MAAMDPNRMDGAEAFRLMNEGVPLPCPVCSTSLVPVPEKWVPGETLHGIFCPTDTRHFLVHYHGSPKAVEFSRNLKKFLHDNQ
jgi:hypothetical protein